MYITEVNSEWTQLQFNQFILRVAQIDLDIVFALSPNCETGCIDISCQTPQIYECAQSSLSCCFFFKTFGVFRCGVLRAFACLMPYFFADEASLLVIQLYLCIVPCIRLRPGISSSFPFALAFCSFSFSFSLSRLSQVIQFALWVRFIEYPFCPFIGGPLVFFWFDFWPRERAQVHLLWSFVGSRGSIDGTEFHNVVPKGVIVLLGCIIFKFQLPCVVIGSHLKQDACLQSVMDWKI